MKRVLRFAAYAAMLSAALVSTACAEEDPPAGREDSRMRTVAYDPNQVFHLSTAVGATLVVSFGAEETVTEVAVTDSKDLKASPARNYLFFKSRAPLSLQPVIVLTTDADGALRRYVFEVTTIDTSSQANQARGIYYSVQFTYPAQDAARARAAALVRRAAEAAEASAREGTLELERAHGRMETEAQDPDAGHPYAGHPYAGLRNWRYMAQGSGGLTPLEVWDNGFSTSFVFPGNIRVPSIFVVDPDGREATANYAVKGNVVEVDGVARQWRLRDGNSLLCVFNEGFDAIGHDPGTGTTSPTVDRITKAPPS